MSVSQDVVMQIPFPDGQDVYPTLKKPIEIGWYSRDKKDHLRRDRSQLPNYRPPKNVEALNLDLNEGYGQLIENRSRFCGCMDDLLWWVMKMHKKGSWFRTHSLKSTVQMADFVCSRGVLAKIASAPYELRQGWVIGTVRFAGVIFLFEFDTDEGIWRHPGARSERRGKYEKVELFTHWGHRFERYMTTGSARGPIIDCNEQYFAIFGTVLKPGSTSSHSRAHRQSTPNREIRLLYGAETDCVDGTGRYVELKTSRIAQNGSQNYCFRRFKLLRWWLQSSLAGIDRVVCGHRDDNGIVKNLETYTVADMPAMAPNGETGNPCWSAEGCMKSLYDILSFVKLHTACPSQPNSLGDVAVFEFDPKAGTVRLIRNHYCPSDVLVPSWFVSVISGVAPRTSGSSAGAQGCKILKPNSNQNRFKNLYACLT